MQRYQDFFAELFFKTKKCLYINKALQYWWFFCKINQRNTKKRFQNKKTVNLIFKQETPGILTIAGVIVQNKYKAFNCILVYSWHVQLPVTFLWQKTEGIVVCCTKLCDKQSEGKHKNTYLTYNYNIFFTFYQYLLIHFYYALSLSIPPALVKIK